jgi:putative endopeptidase
MKGYIAITTMALTVGSFWLAGCGPKDTGGGSTSDAPPHKGIPVEDMDTTVSPREDFFHYANGGFIKRTEIPADQSKWGSFSQLRERTDANVRKLIEEAAEKGGDPGSPGQLIGDYYHTAMDTAKIEQAGLAAAKPLLDEVAALKDAGEMMRLLGRLHRKGIDAAFGIWIDLDEKNSKETIFQIYQGGMGLPEKTYYLGTDAGSVKIRDQYVTYLGRLLELAGEQPVNATAMATKILAFETKLAKASMFMVEMRDPEKTYHKMTLEELGQKSPLLDWKGYFENVGLPNPGSFNVAMPDFLAELSNQAKATPFEDWKTYLRVCVLRDLSSHLNNDFVQNDFEFYEKVLSGSLQIRPRWKRVVEGMNYSFDMAIGQLYVERHFSPEAKKIALGMVDEILATMKERLGELTWLTDSTRQKAIHKVSTILPKIGYPDQWRKWDGLKISRESHIANVLSVREFNFQYRLNKIGKPIDKGEWGMAPQIVNAYYNPTRNEIVFPAGILQAPFFDEKAEPVLNYGGFGAVIGHELIHAFDDAGSQYDAEGNLKAWWTEDDRKNFEERAERVRRQYDAYVVLDTLHVNGSLTLGENIADIFGLRMSYYAWKRSLKGKEAPAKSQGFTPEQRFFIAFGQIWAGKIRDEALRTQIATDPHSPTQFRVLGSLSNLVEFYETFGVKEGDKMYRADSLRASIW